MNLKDYLPDSVKEALFEPETPVAPNPKQGVVKPVGIPPMPVQVMPTVPGADYVPNVPSSNQSAAVTSILADLRSKTDFNSTPVGQQLKEIMDGLADSGLTEDQKSKSAMKITHQSPSQVVAVLQGLQAVLVSEKQHFEASMQTATTAEVSTRQAKSAQLQSSIDDAESKLNAMRQEKSQVDAELQDKQNKIETARKNYASASEARNTELAEMISHYQSIPEVK